MKKIYLLAFSVLLAGGSFAQTAKKKMTKGTSFRSKNVSVAKTKVTNPNEVQAIVWSDDFSTPANWTFVDNLGLGQSWQIGTTGPNQAPTTFLINSTSGGNFAMFDSDGASQTQANDAEMRTANPIDLTGHPNVNLVFEQHYMRYMDDVFVGVSTDAGATWTEYQVNASYATGSNAESPDPETVSVDISAAAGNAAAVLVKFRYVGFWDYWWLVDDVKIEDQPSDDGSVSGVILPAAACGLSATSPVSVSINNIGMNPIVNPGVSLTVDGGTAVNETYTGTIAPGSSVTYTFTATADLSGVMIHTVAVGLTVTNDASLANNTASATVETYPIVSIPMTNSFETADPDLTNYLNYNTDGTSSGWQWDNNFPNTGTNNMLVYENDGAGNPQVGLSEQTLITGCISFTGGTTYRLKYWHFVPNALPTLAADLEINMGSDNNPGALTTNIKPLAAVAQSAAYVQDSVDFTPATTGTYYLGFRAVNSNAAMACVIALDDIEIAEAPLVGIKSNVASDVVSIFPNPNAGVFTVKATENNSSVAVYSIIGENVYSSKLAKGNNSIDLTNLAAGSYIVKVNNGGTLVTKRVVINK